MGKVVSIIDQSSQYTVIVLTPVTSFEIAKPLSLIFIFNILLNVIQRVDHSPQLFQFSRFDLEDKLDSFLNVGEG